LVLEFAGGTQLYVHVDRSYLVQKLGGPPYCAAPVQLTNLNANKWSQPYCVEALPNAYAWPGIGTFPEPPQEPSLDRICRRERSRSTVMAEWQRACATAMTEWRRACATYIKALHANASYRQAAQEYFERQSREPRRLLDWWVYRDIVLQVGPVASANTSNRSEYLLLVKQYVLRRERRVERMRREVETLENYGTLEVATREPIPEHVRLFVWRRDKGQCVRCGSRERLEFDHIIPVVAGGSNTERNVQLLCESCNRSKSATI
jgi:5-methylcytosine-specific restriction endonuclease McrA